MDIGQYNTYKTRQTNVNIKVQKLNRKINVLILIFLAILALQLVFICDIYKEKNKLIEKINKTLNSIYKLSYLLNENNSNKILDIIKINNMSDVKKIKDNINDFVSIVSRVNL